MSTIAHDETTGRFTLEVDGHVTYAAYRRVDATTVEFFTTYTPPPVRGRGLAGRVVAEALGWAQAEGLRVVPSCWYVAEYVQRNPQFAGLVAR